MLQNLKDTASEIIHYRALTVIEGNRRVHKVGNTAFNPRLGKETKLVVFVGETAQDLKINPITGGCDLNNATSYMEQAQDSIDLTIDSSNVDTTLDNPEFKMWIPETPISKLPKSKKQVQQLQNTQHQDTSNSSLNTGNKTSTVVTTAKKQKKSKKGKNKSKNKNTGKKRRQESQDKTDEPPKKKTTDCYRIRWNVTMSLTAGTNRSMLEPHQQKTSWVKTSRNNVISWTG